MELSEANEFVAKLHRHHKPVPGHRFSVGAEHDGKLVGVVIVGRPVAPKTDKKFVAEVTRLCTDGTKNACSFLYATAARIAQELGFRKVQTFILESEPGDSLKAAGWTCEGKTKTNTAKEQWNSRDGRRTDQPTCDKVKWSKMLKT